MHLHEMHAGTGVTCPFCHMELRSAEPIWTCPICSTRHHEECARENGRCTILGCDALVPRDRPRPVVAPVLAATRSRFTTTPRECLVALAAILAFLGPIALTLAFPRAVCSLSGLPFRGYDALFLGCAWKLIMLAWLSSFAVGVGVTIHGFGRGRAPNRHARRRLQRGLRGVVR